MTFSHIFSLLNGISLFSTQMRNGVPITKTESGLVQGLVDYSREGRPYLKYLGIPYGKPPIGFLRFEPPEPVEGWDGILIADKYGPSCMQFDALQSAKVKGAEDCLHLNVFVPYKNVFDSSADIMPVIVYIHGGGFIAGSSKQYNPKYLMDEDIVVVTINYRLGALGFLNTGEDGLIRGNMGFKDQNLAQKWVQKNIRNFKGDPNNVTLMGESAGAASVHYHILSPLSAGLFHRAIMHSGNIFCPWAFTRNPGHQATRFGDQLQCPTDNSSVLVDCLKRMNARTLVKPHAATMSPIHLQDDLFTGSIEAFDSGDAFLSKNPFDLLQEGNFNKVPIILAVNSGEGGLKTARLEAYPEILCKLDEKWGEYVPILLHYDPERTEVGQKIRDYYFGNNAPIPGDLFNLTRMISDSVFFQPNHWAARFHAEFAPVYLGYYSYLSTSLPSAYTAFRAVREPSLIPSDIQLGAAVALDFLSEHFLPSHDPKRLGSCHGDDVLQLWKVHRLAEISILSSDFPFSKNLVKTLASFAKSNDNLMFDNTIWTPMLQNSPHLIYMELNSTAAIITEPFQQSVNFWDELNVRNPHENHNW